MKKETKRVLIAAVAVIILLAVFVGVWFVTRPDVAEGDKTITVEVVHKDESKKTFTYETNEEYLGPVLLNEGLVEGENSEYGLFIQVVDGEEAVYEEDGGWWALYEDGEMAAVGADSLAISDGGSYSLVYTVG